MKYKILSLSVGSFIVISVSLFMIFKNEDKINLYSKDIKKIDYTLEKLDFSKDFARKISSEDDVKCFLDKFQNIEEIKKEIAELEKKVNAPVGANETFKTLSISAFKSAEIVMLKKFGDYIPESDKISSCQNVACILNASLRLDTEAKEGYLLYLFYLNTGYFVSLLDTSPYIVVGIKPNIENGRLTGFMYPSIGFPTKKPSKEEIFNLVKLSYNLPEEFKHRDNVKIIHFVDRVSGIEEYTDNECTKLYRDGDIVLLDWCGGNKTSEALFKELASGLNLLDKVENKISEKAEWLELSKWKKEEGVDDNYKQKWSFEIDSFVSDRAKKNPEKDFLESMYFYRFNPSDLKNKSEVKFNFIKKLLSNKSYDSQGNIDKFSENISASIIENLEEYSLSCSKEMSNKEENEMYLNVKYPIELPITNSNLKECIQSKISDNIQKTIVLSMKNDIDACDFWNSNENKILGSIKAKTEVNIAQFTAKHIDFDESIRKLSIFKDKLSEIDARIAIINCQKNIIKDDGTIVSKEECYNEEIKNNIGKLASDLAISEEAVSNLKNKYIRNNTYIIALNELGNLYDKLFLNFNTQLSDFAQQTFNTCKNAEETSEMPVLTPFDGGSEIKVKAGILNCINRNIVETLPGLVDAYLKNSDIKLENENYKKFIMDNVVYKKTNFEIMTLQISAIKEEEKLLSEALITFEELSNKEISSNNFITKPFDIEKSNGTCKDVLSQLASKLLKDLKPIFLSKNAIVEAISTKACENSMSTIKKDFDKENDLITNKLIVSLAKEVDARVQKTKYKNNKLCVKDVGGFVYNSGDKFSKKYKLEWRFKEKNKTYDDIILKACESIK